MKTMILGLLLVLSGCVTTPQKTNSKPCVTSKCTGYMGQAADHGPPHGGSGY